MDRLRNRVAWALGNVLHILYIANMTLPAGPALHYSTAVHKVSPYMVIVGSILNGVPPSYLDSYLHIMSILLSPLLQ